MTRLIAILFVLFSASVASATDYYVDPDWAGTKSGTAAQPFSSLDATAWSTINTALADGNVTVYYTALVDNGTTQYTLTSADDYLVLKRSDASTNRLIIDGYSKYNTNSSSPSWSDNPTAIVTAYTAGKVFKIVLTDGSLAIGVLRTNTPTSLNKQSYLTIRGFEVTGYQARITFAGDSNIWEYIYQHDVTNMGSAMSLHYVYPDSGCDNATLDRQRDNSDGIIIRNIRIVDVYGECIYIGGIPSECTIGVMAETGVTNKNITISDFYLHGCGKNGAQGDGIDIKLGVQNITISDGEIYHINNAIGAITAVPHPFLGEDMNLVVERVYIHDPEDAAVNGGVRIPASDISQNGGPATTTPSNLSNVTVRNCIVDSMGRGITIYRSDAIEDFKNINIYNNTVYGISGNPGIYATQIEDELNVKNNLVFGNNSDGAQITVSATTNLACDYNVFYGTESEVCANGVSMTESQRNSVVADAPNGIFSIPSGSVVVDAGTSISGFADDFAKIFRPRGSTWDIGAYEYTGSTNTHRGRVTGNLSGSMR